MKPRRFPLRSRFSSSSVMFLLFSHRPFWFPFCTLHYIWCSEPKKKKIVLRRVDYRYRHLSKGNKNPLRSTSSENSPWIRSFAIAANRSAKAKTGRFGGISHPLDSSVIYRRPLERSLSLYSHSGFFPSLYFSVLFLSGHMYGFFSIPLKDRSTMSDRRSTRSTLGRI